MRFRRDGMAAGAIAALAALLTTASAPEDASARWYADYDADGRLVRIGADRGLYMYCAGSGSPTVILESGLTESAFSWWAVQPAVARVTRVCSYDRAGLGRSPSGPPPRDLRARAADLERLLASSRMRTPYILVGHSAGGFAARVLASRHPEKVAGLVLVDASVENPSRVFESISPAIAENNRRSARRAKACADPGRSKEVAALCTRPAPPGLSPRLAALWARSFDLRYSQAVAAEMSAFVDVDSAQMSEEQRPFGSLPLVVLTRGRRSGDLPASEAEAEWTLWNRMHDDLARLSTSGANTVVPDAGHYIQIDKPQVVIDAILRLVEQARRGPGVATRARSAADAVH